ncbi:hypothetical protein ACFPIJ_30495 [Dactylosporangium cerinum]|uniref:Uncharacterized protein n=1 Tax=Dactylosporangium cerinum TaxID=1434730 RepID=A0ABV9W1A0_9ACTN
MINYGAFAQRLAQQADRWSLLDEIHAEWGFQDPGGDPPHTREGGENLAGEVDPGLPVPSALDEWWQRPVNSFLFNPRLYWTHSQWPPAVAGELPEQNPFTAAGDDRRVCGFMSEYHYSNTWGYLAAEAHLPDPRVLVDRGDGWVLQNRSISEFLLHLTLDRLPAAYGWSLTFGPDAAGADVVQRLREQYPELGLPPWQEMGVDAVLHGAPDALVSHGRGAGAAHPVLIRARSRDALTAVAESLGLTWDDKAVTAPSFKPLRPLRLRAATLPAGSADGRGRWHVVSFVDGATDPATVDGAPAPAAVDGASAQGAVDGASAPGAVDGGTAARHQVLHRAPVTAVVLAGQPGGGHTVVSGDADGVLRSWPVDGTPRRTPLDRRPAPVTALAAAELSTGPALFAAWEDGLVRAWDRTTGATADLRLGTGIEAIAVDGSAVMSVRIPAGTATVQLDLDRLWPTRDLQRRLAEIDWAKLWSTLGPAYAVPRLMAQAASDDEETALDAAKQLYKLLVSRSSRLSAAPPAVPFLVDLMLLPDAKAQNLVLMLIADIADTRRGTKKPDEVAAVRAAIPALARFRDDERGNIRWAMAEVERICAEYPY